MKDARNLVNSYGLLDYFEPMDYAYVEMDLCDYLANKDAVLSLVHDNEELKFTILDVYGDDVELNESDINFLIEEGLSEGYTVCVWNPDEL